MKAFHHPDEALHAPQFFLTRGTVRSNFEIPARAAALRAGLEALGLAPATTPPATREELLKLNTPEYLEFLEQAAAQWAELPGAGPEVVANMFPTPEMLAQTQRAPTHVISRAGAHMADTACPIGPGTWTAAIGAAGCALAAADVAAQGGAAYALCRPPGHHAYAGRAGGHCYINNSALAAQRLRDAGAARVAVLDIDSHHGNGTQGIFWDRDDVLTISIHGDPARYYPWYVGFAEETGDREPQSAAGIRHGRRRVARRARQPPSPPSPPSGPTRWSCRWASTRASSSRSPRSRSRRDGFARAGAAIGRLGLPTAICQEGGLQRGSDRQAAGTLPHRLRRFEVNQLNPLVLDTHIDIRWPETPDWLSETRQCVDLPQMIAGGMSAAVFIAYVGQGARDHCRPCRGRRAGGGDAPPHPRPRRWRGEPLLRHARGGGGELRRRHPRRALGRGERLCHGPRSRPHRAMA
ncbi:hypothetical protein [Roseococcus sp.]|uniref:hypothetical protein n=1 Tax=Roseococcus sp. TaxID=2109646 RepID=UPI003BAABCEA